MPQYPHTRSTASASSEPPTAPSTASKTASSPTSPPASCRRARPRPSPDCPCGTVARPPASGRDRPAPGWLGPGENRGWTRRLGGWKRCASAGGGGAGVRGGGGAVGFAACGVAAAGTAGQQEQSPEKHQQGGGGRHRRPAPVCGRGHVHGQPFTLRSSDRVRGPGRSDSGASAC